MFSAQKPAKNKCLHELLKCQPFCIICHTGKSLEEEERLVHARARVLRVWLLTLIFSGHPCY
jgi:hypothetical protein